MNTAAHTLTPEAASPVLGLRLAHLKSRFPSPWELYSLLVLAGAAVFIPASYLTTWMPEVHSPLRYSGLACPLCGGTRAVTALCTGQFALAFKYNPLAVGVFAVFLWAMFSWFFMVLPFKRRVEIVAPRKVIALLWTLVGLLFLLNWVYVLWAGMYEVPLKF